MVAIPKSLVETNTITWSADGSPSTTIDTSGLITRITLEVELTPSATLTGANQPDGLNRLVQNFVARGDSFDYFSLPGDDGAQAGTIVRYLNYMDGMGIGHGNGAVAAPARAFTGVRFAFHCGAMPKHPTFGDNPYDLSACIPAGMLSSLRLIWTTSGNDILDDTVTVSSATGRIGVSRVHGTPAEIMEFARKQGVTPGIRPMGNGFNVKIPAWIGQAVGHTQTTTAFETDSDDLTSGAYLKRLTVLAQDATATRTLRAGDEITEIRIWESTNKTPIYQQTAEMIQAGLPSAFNVEADDGGQDFQGGAPQGLYPIDFRPMMNPVYGFNLNSDVVGNRKFRIGYLIGTYASGDDRLLLEERISDVVLSQQQMMDAAA